MSKKPIKNQFFTEHDDGSITFNSNLIVSDTPRTDAAKEGGESWMELAALSAQLERENASLREDKARLDWLEANLYTLWASGLRCNESPAVEISARSGRFEAESIRAAIDAAMEKEAQP